MKVNELKTTRQKKPTRVGRGIAAGKGKTAGRGTKGQGARKSGGVRPGFEGGQLPLYMRLPKLRGFKSHRAKPAVVYTGQLEALGKSKIDSKVLAEAGIIDNPYTKVKLIVNGDLKKKIEVSLTSASEAAVKMVVKAGGKFERADQLKRPKKNTKK
ncbi:MAG TPA: 50S ribosomal protein L15 [Candidatus Saccharimonadales bacterium]|nr:50S ribosomal protein L15 [Candidatus Saccharimonadales bacterium]